MVTAFLLYARFQKKRSTFGQPETCTSIFRHSFSPLNWSFEAQASYLGSRVTPPHSGSLCWVTRAPCCAPQQATLQVGRIQSHGSMHQTQLKMGSPCKFSCLCWNPRVLCDAGNYIIWCYPTVLTNSLSFSLDWEYLVQSSESGKFIFSKWLLKGGNAPGFSFFPQLFFLH